MKIMGMIAAWWATLGTDPCPDCRETLHTDNPACEEHHEQMLLSEIR